MELELLECEDRKKETNKPEGKQEQSHRDQNVQNHLGKVQFAERLCSMRGAVIIMWALCWSYT